MVTKLSYEELERRVKELEALKENEAGFRLLYERTPIPYQSLDGEGQLLEVNQAWLDTLGYERDEVIGKSFGDFLHSEWIELFKENFKRVKAIGEVLGIELMMSKKDGSHIMAAFNGRIGKDEQGNFRQTHCIFRDVTEERKLKEALNESRKRLSESNKLMASILEHTHMMSAYLDRHFNFIWVNRAYADNGGHEPDFFRGKNHFDLYPHEENQAIFQGVVDTGEPFFATAKPFEFPDQPERGVGYWDWSLIPVRDVTGDITGLVFTLTEVTDLIRTQEALRENERQYRSLVETTRVVAWEMDLETFKFTYVSPRIEDLTGYPSEMWKDFDFWVSVVHPDDRDYAVEFCKVEASLERDHEFEYRMTISDGKVVWIRDIVTVIKKDVKPVALQGYFIDITDLKQAEESLRVSEVRHREILRTAMDGFLLVDLQGRLMEVNDAYCRMTGYSEPELLSMGISDLEAVETPADTIDHIRRAMAQGSERFESRHRRKDGSIFEVEVSLQYQPEKEGNFVSFLRDITERKRAEAELRRSRDELELRVRKRTAELEKSNRRLKEVNKKLQDFTFIASHDLQEPLRKIRVLGDMLATKAKGSLDEAAIDYIKRMLHAAERMKELLDFLSAYSRVSTRSEPREKTDLNKSIEEALSNLEFMIKEKNAYVEIGDLPTIEADPIQMVQLFQNLIGNALKYQKNDKVPQVRIYLQHPESGKKETHEICVEDNGIGIDEKYIDQIFIPFQRLHVRSEYEGLGMGLAICSKIVERHGGRITTKSELNKGSTFIVTLPARKKG